MTFDTAKRLYDFYIETKQDARAAELALKYPELSVAKEEPVKVKKAKKEVLQNAEKPE